VPLAIDHITDAVTLRESQASPHLGRWSEDVPDRPLKVLQVEDNATNRDVAEKILARVGHTVFSVANGAEALKALKEQTFDIVIMDRHMPTMNGIEATRRIRAMDPPLNAIPIIGVTAAASEDDVNACLQAGMDLVLTKPLRTKDLRTTVARLAAPAAEHLVFRPDVKVLVVDDMEINRTVAGRQLEKLGAWRATWRKARPEPSNGPRRGATTPSWWTSRCRTWMASNLPSTFASGKGTAGDIRPSSP